MLFNKHPRGPRAAGQPSPGLAAGVRPLEGLAPELGEGGTEVSGAHSL